MTTPRPIRFGVGPGSTGLDALVDVAKKAEVDGFSTFGLADHLFLPMAPLIALQAIADATTTLRLTTTVLAHDFRHPAILAKDLATLDELSGGRVEVGIGAGHTRADYDQTGLQFDPPSVRIERLEEYATILKGLFTGDPFSFEGKHFTITELAGTPTPVQRPGPPIMIGGGGPKLLAAAARHADIVQVAFTTRPDGILDVSQFTAASLEKKVAIVRDAAGDRVDDIELSTVLFALVITDDRDRVIDKMLGRFNSLVRAAGSVELTAADLIESPSFAIGTVDEICAQLREARERFGFSYFAVVGDGNHAAVRPVLDELSS